RPTSLPSCWFRGCGVCWPFQFLRRVLFEFLERDVDGSFQLRGFAGDDPRWRLLAFDIRGDAPVFDAEAGLGPEGEIGCGDQAAVHEHGEAKDTDEAAPGALADERAELVLVEHPGQQVAAGAGGFVDEHDLGAEDGGAWRLDVFAVARGPHGGERP